MRGGRRHVSDILQLSTRQPMADYLPGGKLYRQRMRRRFLLSALLKTLMFAAVLAAAIYILWQIPGAADPAPSDLPGGPILASMGYMKPPPPTSIAA